MSHCLRHLSQPGVNCAPCSSGWDTHGTAKLSPAAWRTRPGLYLLGEDLDYIRICSAIRAAVVAEPQIPPYTSPGRQESRRSHGQCKCCWAPAERGCGFGSSSETHGRDTAFQVLSQCQNRPHQQQTAICSLNIVHGFFFPDFDLWMYVLIAIFSNYFCNFAVFLHLLFALLSDR